MRSEPYSIVTVVKRLENSIGFVQMKIQSIGQLYVYMDR